MVSIDTELSTRKLYATDASVYRQLPEGVSYPAGQEECVELVKHASNSHKSLIPRTAGTSIAGQCVGSGLIVDVSRDMNSILSDPFDYRIKVQPGVILDELNEFLRPYNLKFAPDTSTSNRCMIGGMIGNNAAGSYSVLYGTTREHVHSVTTVVGNGEVLDFGPLEENELQEKLLLKGIEGNIYRTVYSLVDQHRKAILDAYPDQRIIRRNTGYALDCLARGQPWVDDGPKFNLAKILCGSEGTLALVTEATLNLVDTPASRSVVCIHFSSIDLAMSAIEEILSHEPSAVELIDKRILDLSKENIEQSRHQFWIEGDPAAVLVVEFFNEAASDETGKSRQLIDSLTSAGVGYAYRELGGSEINSVWSLRKAGLGLLMGVTQKRKPVAVIEDTAVLPANLAGYVKEIQALMKKHSVECVYYGHASVGLLHFRPELDLSDKKDVETFKAIATDVAALVKKYHGSLSGEHGDGRVRGPFLRQMIGDEIYDIHIRIKKAFDPNNIFNPDKILTSRPIDENLRPAVRKSDIQIQTGFNWHHRHGLHAELNKCNGAAVCRKRTGRVMCPSYRATGNELFSTRGRSSLLNYLFSGDGSFTDALNDSRLKDAMDSCLSCKACRAECPSNVDMARLKSEYLYQRHRRVGLDFQDRMARYFPLYLSFAAKSPGLFGQIQRSELFKRLSGTRGGADLPMVSRVLFSKWWNEQKSKNTKSSPSDREMILLVDMYAEYYEPEIAISAVKVLQSLGNSVIPIVLKSSPRFFISLGFLDEARSLLSEIVDDIHSVKTSLDMPVIVLDPAEFSVFKEEIHDLTERDPGSVVTLADSVRFFDDYLLEYLENDCDERSRFFNELSDSSVTIAVHEHCHQKSSTIQNATHKMLNMLPGVNAEILQTGCCGMAGQLGYTNPSLSRSVAQDSFLPEIQRLSERHLLVSSGTSCRTQIRNLTDRHTSHPAVFIADRLGISSNTQV